MESKRDESSTRDRSGQRVQIVCPFCPLGCDDVAIIVPNEATALAAMDVDCELAKRRFASCVTPDPPRIGSRVVSVNEAESYLSERAREAGRIAVITGGVDIVTSKRLADWVAARRIVWQLDQHPLHRAWQRVSSRDGVITATLGDVRLHADLVWTIGDIASEMPRIHHLIQNDSITRQMIATPGPLDPEWLARLVLETREQSKNNEDVTLSHLVGAIESARYVAVLVGPDAFAEVDAEGASSLLVQWIWKMNRSRRAVVLCLDPCATPKAVYRWRTNQSLATGRGDGSEPAAFVVRLGTFERDHARVDVAIGVRDPGIDHAACFAPASQVGIHTRGAVIRGDSTVTLPLSQVLTTPHRSEADWLEQLLEA